MKLASLLSAAIAATALFVGIGTQGCSSATDATSGVKCTPGAYVFCRCADQGKGTKLCKEDGASFEACTTDASGECVGGEDLTDPETGNQVTPPPPPEEGEKPPVPAGPPGSAVDACPGKPTAVTPGAATVVDGDTTGAKSDVKGKAGACAVGDGGPDHIYDVVATGSGSLDIEVQGIGALNPLVYVRTACADEATQSACAPPLGAGKLVKSQINVVVGQHYFIVVDGASGSAGKYKLTMKLTTGGFCGDGKIDSGEACDDINKTDGDGCSPSCRGINGDPATADCTKPHEVHMWKGAVISGTGSTGKYGNSFAKPGTSCDPSIGSNLAPDHVYAVIAHTAGTLKVTLTPTEATYNVVLVARKTCTDPASQTLAMCGNLGSAGAPETISLPVQNNEKIFIAADGALNAQGTYTIKFELP